MGSKEKTETSELVTKDMIVTGVDDLERVRKNKGKALPSWMTGGYESEKKDEALFAVRVPVQKNRSLGRSHKVTLKDGSFLKIVKLLS